jgi:protein gp37
MAANSKIEWTECTWNPVTGCTKVSPGCLNCYAERMARRLQAMGQPNYRNGFEVTLHPHMLALPLRWKQSRTVFVNSMSDLFHEDVPLDFIRRVFDVMARAPQHRFQILTKRSGRLAELSGGLPWPSNVWMGVTVESDDYAWRIDDLRRTDAAIKFISFEPLLGAITSGDLEDIDWVIAGGESGPGARRMDYDWVADVRDQCLAARVPFFFKQWGGVNKKANGRALDHRICEEVPRETTQRELTYAAVATA